MVPAPRLAAQLRGIPRPAIGTANRTDPAVAR